MSCSSLRCGTVSSLGCDAVFWCVVQDMTLMGVSSSGCDTLSGVSSSAVVARSDK